jgi:hypothetical protein
MAAFAGLAGVIGTLGAAEGADITAGLVLVANSVIKHQPRLFKSLSRITTMMTIPLESLVSKFELICLFVMFASGLIGTGIHLYNTAKRTFFSQRLAHTQPQKGLRA